MASGDTKTQQYLDIAANGTRADLPSDTCCETRTQTLIRGVAERIMDVEDEVERLENNPDVADIVATYADLQAYPTSQLTDKDVVRVLQDETHDGDSTYYRWSTTTQAWTYIGESKQYSDFVGTDGTAGGQNGLVPAPVATDAGKFLNANGSWEEVQAGASYTAGDGIDITNDVISATNTGKAKVLTTADYNWPTNNPDSIALWLLEPGLYQLDTDMKYRYRSSQRLTGNNNTFLIGKKRVATHFIPVYNMYYQVDTSKTIGTLASVSDDGTSYSVNFGSNLISNLTSTNDTSPLAASQGKVLKNLIDSIAIRGAGAPTASTAGQVGTLYEDTTNGDLYICTDATNPYVWEAVGGGAGVTELTSADYNYDQGNTGANNCVALWKLDAGDYFAGAGVAVIGNNSQSTTALTALAKSITVIDSTYNSGSADYAEKVWFVSTVSNIITGSAFASSGNAITNPSYPFLRSIDLSQSTGTSTTQVMSQNATTSMVYADPSTTYKVRIGATSSVTGENGTAVGRGAVAGKNAVSLGFASRASAIGSIAIGMGSTASVQGEFNVGTSNTYNGYNSSNYRLLTGLYDPQSAHDAATKGYVDGLISALEARIAALEEN